LVVVHELAPISRNCDTTQRKEPGRISARGGSMRPGSSPAPVASWPNRHCSYRKCITIVCLLSIKNT
jgi:hypothetical protein